MTCVKGVKLRHGNLIPTGRRCAPAIRRRLFAADEETT
jgi:hypothetical protein